MDDYDDDEEDDGVARVSTQEGLGAPRFPRESDEVGAQTLCVAIV